MHSDRKIFWNVEIIIIEFVICLEFENKLYSVHAKIINRLRFCNRDD